MIDHQFDDPAACLEMKNVFERDNSTAPELPRGKYVCMKRSIPAASRTPYKTGSEG
jgi:hypothetical protein